ncbi:MAG TPA: hypothetical protein VLJ39_04355 [Tepidisphaeraceae bacterium]|nr:hypothetical protein [Tepidisphaeraceae bacterium]
MSQIIHPTPLLDLLASSKAPHAGEPQNAGGLATRALQLIDFELSEYARITELDLGMGRLSLRHTDPHGAAAMRSLYQQWASQADELLARLRNYGLHEQLEEKYEELERAVGRTLAMLSVTLDSLAQADEQARTGQTFSLEEVRRELRAAAGR